MPYLAMSDEAKIYYEDHGKGETILFIHGLNSSHTKIRDFINDFKADYRTVYYDSRGHAMAGRCEMHMNIKRMGQDLRELIEYLDLDDITVIGHSMGAATIFSYVNQYGCDRLKRIVAVDMSPYMRNTVWEGGIGQGSWTDEDFLQDLDRYFDDHGNENWVITKNLMYPFMKDMPEDPVNDANMRIICAAGMNPFTSASLWYSLFRTDQRPAISKINVPFMYVMPETPLYSMVNVNFLKENVQDKFVLRNDFPGTTHMILLETPHPVADAVKEFLQTT